MLLIKNGHVVDPFHGTDAVRDLYVSDGKVLPAHLAGAPADEVIDAAGMIVAPGLVDMHVHFRDPGQTHKEDLLSGALAAAAGGVTTAVCMPNTDPVIDTPEAVARLLERAEGLPIHVLPYAAVSAGQKGTEPTDWAALIKAGAAALSDDGMPVMDAALMRRALKAAAAGGFVISSHCEDLSLAQNFAVNEGAVSRELGIPGRPAIAEEIMVMRDLMLAEETGAHIHIAHVSTARSVALIEEAKRRGVRVTAETCPHYFALTEKEILAHGAAARVNPPLRTEKDVAAIVAGLQSGAIDAIATDHAPHAADEKALPLTEAPSGISGLETYLALALTYLYHTGRLDLMAVIDLMSTAPAAILGLDKGRIGPGDEADIVIFDPDEEWTVSPARFFSRGKSTPFAGARLKGRVKYTICRGKLVYKD